MVIGGAGGDPGGAMGSTAVPGQPGTNGFAGFGLGGGIAINGPGKATIDDTTITGNTASSGDNDVDGTFST